MEKRHFKLSLLALAFAGVSTFAAANDSGFYERKGEGWFWYNEEIEPEPEEPKKEPELPPPPIEEVAKQEPVKLPPAPPPAAEGPEPFSAEWVRVMLPKYLDKAWSEPTVENVRAYYYLQRFSIDRSEQFALAAQLAVQGDPLLDETSRRPLASYAVHELDRRKDDETRRLVQEISKKAGIFFFIGPDCDGCEIQAPIIKDLERVDGFAIIPVSVDGAQVRSVQFENIRKDEGHAEHLGVLTYPATYLATPDGQFSVIGQGAYALSEMRQRILLAAKAADLITDDEFGKTRPILNHNTNIADSMSEEMLEALKAKHSGSADEDNMIPPSELVKFFRENKGIYTP
jgi:conjugal transfer pilus assembly protein TraF